MELNRNQFFLAGLVILMLGFQFRAVESIELNQQTSQAISKGLSKVRKQQPKPTMFLTSASPTQVQTIRPPRWIGFALLSVGSVLVLHSLAMRKPE